MNPDISVCICAYKRPALLRELLASLQAQVERTPRFEIIVVDNDARESSAAVAAEFARARVPVRYFREPRQNIALARNRSFSEAAGSLIATIDDDESAAPNWLFELHETLINHDADAAFGPVHAKFEQPPPKWIADGDFFDYLPIPNGEFVPLEATRTSNTLLRRKSLPSATDVFDENLGLTGGEDLDLFRRMLERGARFVAAESALVYETIPPDRARLKWLALRRFRYGTMRVTVHEGKGDSASHKFRTAGQALTGMLTGLSRATLKAPRRRTRSAQEFLRACYWAGVLADIAGFRYEEYKDAQASESPRASGRQDGRTSS